MYCCSHNGSSTTLPKNSPYANSMATVLTEKLRERNSDRSTIGCSSVSSQIRKIANVTTATQASATIVAELNQSRSLPWSSSTCNAPTQITSSARPTVSTGTFAVGVSRL